MFVGEGVFDLPGVMETYRFHLQPNLLNFSGPTNFAQTLKMLNETAELSLTTMNYDY